jgi:acetyl/propionyl-CoA carboxylase alpha subunit
MAAKSFGNGAVFLERYVPRARHIEIQVFGFGNGEAVHLFERDCSLQRRFQKVIEESPAPSIPEDITRNMAEAALRLVRAVRYGGAGTIEFIVDAETFEYFFLEMNTRIQVEHPVTEMITGRDLVAMQLDFARGRLTQMDQSDITRQGHAIECRLYAENPAKMFMPSPGMLQVFDLPEGLPGLRVDSGYQQGDTVTPFYDPMVAKIITWGETRAEARSRSIAALGRLSLEGIRNNREFLIACLKDEEFAGGNVHTNFIDARRNVLIAA